MPGRCSRDLAVTDVDERDDLPGLAVPVADGRLLLAPARSYRYEIAAQMLVMVPSMVSASVA
jgi:hypothetical protein